MATVRRGLKLLVEVTFVQCKENMAARRYNFWFGNVNKSEHSCANSEFLAAIIIKLSMDTPCRLVETNTSFGRACCLRLQGAKILL